MGVLRAVRKGREEGETAGPAWGSHVITQRPCPVLRQLRPRQVLRGERRAEEGARHDCRGLLLARRQGQVRGRGKGHGCACVSPLFWAVLTTLAAPFLVARFKNLVDSLLVHGDRFCLLKDYADYMRVRCPCGPSSRRARP